MTTIDPGRSCMDVINIYNALLELLIQALESFFLSLEKIIFSSKIKNWPETLIVMAC